jgi:G:T-mismatch repair DNA endonuclease (very short patch repair protein)
LRDRRNNMILRRSGWKVIRIWEHQVDQRYLAKLEATIRQRFRMLSA